VAAGLDGQGVMPNHVALLPGADCCGKILEKIPFAWPILSLMGRQVLFFSPDQHNNFDHFSAGFTSFHRKEEIRSWYDGWDDVAVRYAGVANESIYARGRHP
jgi:hypothetical protein